jgi:hypothetical protein
MTCAPVDVRAASVDGLVKTLVGADGDGKILAGGRKLPTTASGRAHRNPWTPWRWLEIDDGPPMSPWT